ncbi:MAG: cobyric acid synthase [bacterium]|nr:cobyric acid synthase [bacterium]
MRGKALQICGTGSGVGKSVITAGLCRIFLQDGFRVAPFKAQNMALNSFVTKGGGEIGRAQAVQAQASRLEPTVDMNPVLIKPSSDTGAQVIVLGKPLRNMEAVQYIEHKKDLIKTVHESFDRLINKYEAVVIEGAGSPAEVNLKSHDFVNMKMAEYAKAPVILVCDIDKGGALAWVVGTLELLTKKERKRIKGIIINKFRGDINLLTPGVRFLEKRTGIKVLGVIPYFRDVRIPEEDSVPLEVASCKSHLSAVEEVTSKKIKKIDIAVIYLPHISNFTDFDPLEKEPDVLLRYVRRPEELGSPDIIILPGTKNTIGDLKYLKNSGFAEKILVTYDLRLVTILGICGGYQMLGRKILDSHSLESNCKKTDGLGVLPVVTSLEKEKILRQVKGKELFSGEKIYGYEIHHGRTKVIGKYSHLFEINERDGKKVRYFDGIVSGNKQVYGTYLHGIFDNNSFRRDFLNRIRSKKGWPVLSQTTDFNVDMEFDKLADVIRKNIDMDYLYKTMKI